MDRGFGNDGDISDLPWTAVFDPVANARALSAIQAEGFRAAAKLVDRFVTIAETNGNGAEASSASAGNGSAASNSTPNSDVDPILSSWWSLWGRLLRSMPGPNAGGSGSVTFELTGENANGPVHLHADGAGCRATAEVWLHNRATDDLGRFRLRCSDLLANDGCVISSDAVTLSRHCRSNAQPVEPRNRRENRGAARCSTRRLPRHPARRGPPRLATGGDDRSVIGLMTSIADRPT